MNDNNQYEIKMNTIQINEKNVFMFLNENAKRKLIRFLGIHALRNIATSLGEDQCLNACNASVAAKIISDIARNKVLPFTDALLRDEVPAYLSIELANIYDLLCAWLFELQTHSEWSACAMIWPKHLCLSEIPDAASCAIDSTTSDLNTIIQHIASPENWNEWFIPTELLALPKDVSDGLFARFFNGSICSMA